MLFPDSRVLIILQNLIIASSGIAVYLLARKYKLQNVVSLSLLVSYFMFYGIQFALWSDVHSLVFGIGFLAWFLYFLETQRIKPALAFLLLTITSKEDLGLLTGAVSLIFFVIQRKKEALLYIGISGFYLFAIFFIYFPYFSEGYRFQNEQGLLSDVRISNMYNTPEKRDSMLYALAWYGFLPVLQPLYLIPALLDLAHYFILGSNYVTQAQGLFGHYRSSLALLLIWPTIITIAKIKRLNTVYTAAYILICAFALQYVLHLPLSYLTKQWFWHESQSVRSIHSVKQHIPEGGSLVVQSNFVPHVGARDEMFLIWPDTKSFTDNSPCGKKMCKWLRWVGKPQYMLVDTGADWDIRHYLANREDFLAGLQNVEKAGIIKPHKTQGTTILYTVLKNPKD
jgi:uncharacterized membrane protein